MPDVHDPPTEPQHDIDCPLCEGVGVVARARVGQAAADERGEIAKLYCPLCEEGVALLWGTRYGQHYHQQKWPDTEGYECEAWQIHLRSRELGFDPAIAEVDEEGEDAE